MGGEGEIFITHWYLWITFTPKRIGAMKIELLRDCEGEFKIGR